MKEPFEVQEGRCDFPRDATVEKGLISLGGENLPVFSRVAAVSSRVETCMSGNFLSCGKGVKDPIEFRREGMISLETPQRKRASCLLEGRISLFFSSCGWFLLTYDGDLGDPLVWPQERPVSIRVFRGASRDSSPVGAGS